MFLSGKVSDNTNVGTLTSAYFSSSGTWTAPVSTVAVLSGVGGPDTPSTPGVWYTNTTVGYSSMSADNAPGFPFVGTLDWSSVYNDAIGLASAANAGGSGERTINAQYYLREVRSSDNWTTARRTLNYPGTVIRGTATLSSWGAAKTSGQVLYSEGSGFWDVIADKYSPGSPAQAGSPAYALGYSFAGDPIGGTASVTTYTNVAVNIGQSYSISVPSGGFVQIQYYQ